MRRSTSKRRVQFEVSDMEKIWRSHDEFLRIVESKAREVGMTELQGRLPLPHSHFTVYYGTQQVSDALVNMLKKKIL